jgi:hypothetical protein
MLPPTNADNADNRCDIWKVPKDEGGKQAVISILSFTV